MLICFFLLDTAFKQQRLKAWQPLLTPKTVLPTLFVAGVIFAPLGGLFLYQSDTVSTFEIMFFFLFTQLHLQVNEIVIDYTHCFQNNGTAVLLDDSLYSYKIYC